MKTISRTKGRFCEGSMSHCNLKLRANVSLNLYNCRGDLIVVLEKHNIITELGLSSILDQLLDNPTVAVPGYMELGTGVPGVERLGEYVPGSRTVFSEKSLVGTTLAMRCVFPAGVGTGLITEAGIFNSDVENSGDMYLSTSFAEIPKGETDVLKVLWTITASNP